MNTQKLKGLIIERGYTQRKLAKLIGVSEATMYSKMQKGIFGTDEATHIMNILHISKEEAGDIFLAKNTLVKCEKRGAKK